MPRQSRTIARQGGLRGSSSGAPACSRRSEVDRLPLACWRLVHQIMETRHANKVR